MVVVANLILRSCLHRINKITWLYEANLVEGNKLVQKSWTGKNLKKLLFCEFLNYL